MYVIRKHSSKTENVCNVNSAPTIRNIQVCLGVKSTHMATTNNRHKAEYRFLFLTLYYKILRLLIMLFVLEPNVKGQISLASVGVISRLCDMLIYHFCLTKLPR